MPAASSSRNPSFFKKACNIVRFTPCSLLTIFLNVRSFCKGCESGCCILAASVLLLMDVITLRTVKLRTTGGNTFAFSKAKAKEVTPTQRISKLVFIPMLLHKMEIPYGHGLGMMEIHTYSHRSAKT